MSTSTYKGKNIFVDTAGGEYVSMGGRDSEMTFGFKKLNTEVEYAECIHDVMQITIAVIMILKHGFELKGCSYF